MIGQRIKNNRYLSKLLNPATKIPRKLYADLLIFLSILKLSNKIIQVSLDEYKTFCQAEWALIFTYLNEYLKKKILATFSNSNSKKFKTLQPPIQNFKGLGQILDNLIKQQSKRIEGTTLFPNRYENSRLNVSQHARFPERST